MISLTRLNHTSLVLNADLIEWIEVTPDTVISLTTGQKLVVLETPEEVVARVLEYRRAIFSHILECPRLLECGGSSPDPTEAYARQPGQDC
jgi:flagellar protein FlbD